MVLCHDSTSINDSSKPTSLRVLQCGILKAIMLSIGAIFGGSVLLGLLLLLAQEFPAAPLIPFVQLILLMLLNLTVLVIALASAELCNHFCALYSTYAYFRQDADHPPQDCGGSDSV